MKGAIWYRDGWLAPGSVAHNLYLRGEMQALSKHMDEVDRRYRALHGKDLN